MFSRCGLETPAFVLSQIVPVLHRPGCFSAGEGRPAVCLGLRAGVHFRCTEANPHWKMISGRRAFFSIGLNHKK